MTVIHYHPRNPTIPIPSFTREIKSDVQEFLRNEKNVKAIQNFLEGKVVKSTRRVKLAVSFIGVTAFAMMLGFDTVEAASQLSASEQEVLNQIDDILSKIQWICAGISVGLATLMAMIAGFFRMIGLREEAKKRYQDAVAGMTMVLTAPVVLGVLATFVRGLIRLFPNYGI